MLIFRWKKNWSLSLNLNLNLRLKKLPPLALLPKLQNQPLTLLPKLQLRRNNNYGRHKSRSNEC